ncbi:unnamed protein product [Cercospora beticola]|nr:unnamed protein product [Cercospora beticola]
MKAVALVLAIALFSFTCALIGDYRAERTDGTAENTASEEKADQLNSMA